MKHLQLKPFKWVHPRGSFSSRCDLDIYMAGERAAVIATQREEDPHAGLSISNAAEILATIVMQKFYLQPEKMVWIEHYPEKRLGRGGIYRLGETYSRVRFSFNGLHLVSPRWEKMDREGAETYVRLLKNGMVVF